MLPNQPIDVSALVAEREKIVRWLKLAQAREMEIRKQLVSHFVSKLTSPLKEGTNNVEADGFAVKFIHSMTRTLDQASLESVMQQFPEDSPYRKVGVLIDYKPVLVMDGYRSLDDQNRTIFEQAMTIKEGAPTLTEIVPITKPATPIMDAYHKAKRKPKSSEDLAMEAHECLRKQISSSETKTK